jgi:hypothetical protein
VAYLPLVCCSLPVASYRRNPHPRALHSTSHRQAKTDSQFADPRFVDPSKNDFHLQVGSAAIHAGRSAGVRVVGERGLDGGGRVNGSSIDAGCYESR